MFEFSITGYVYSICCDMACIIVKNDKAEIEMTFKQDLLEKQGLFHKGLHFEIKINETEEGTYVTTIIPRPDLDKNKWSEAAMKIDTSYLDKDIV